MKPLIDSGKLVMLGVIQEQHADRCRLFKQWQQLDFPVVQDLLNTNGIDAVPVYIAIDEHGIVRGRPRRPDSFVSDFVDQTFDPPSASVATLNSRDADPAYWSRQIDRQPTVNHLVRGGDTEIIWSADLDAVQQAIGFYRRADEQALAGEDPRADIQFRLGAAYRLWYELDGQSDPALFEQSVEHWESALDRNPNQYIYRRRIQQYGPRLSKPYSFYDWVTQARDEIRSRGEEPIPLAVEPNGAELAQRAREMEVDASAENPDPDSRITLDDGHLVQVHANVVPTEPKPGAVVAVHLGFHVSQQAKWNHETTPMSVWLDQPAVGGSLPARLSSRLLMDQAPYAVAESRQPISISLELQIPEDQRGPLKLTGFALFNICETINGQCVYRRRNFSVEIPVSTP